jgi:hypothetical protein
LRVLTVLAALTVLAVLLRSTEPNLSSLRRVRQGELEAVDEETLTFVQRPKLERYSLFERKSNGGAQPSAAWYQQNAEPAYACLFEERIGPEGEGGKWVCNPEKLRRSKECIVYSVGSNNDFRFEEAILKNISSSCDVHVFDHTDTNPSNIPRGVKFHPWGLAAASDTSNAMFTLHDILERLGHVGKVIYIFKIDREGCEWTTYPTWLDSENGVLIDEILVEVHAGTTAPRENPIARQFMQTLYDHNFLIFHKEPNVQYSSGDGLCVEYAFKRVSDTEIKGDAAAVHEK